MMPPGLGNGLQVPTDPAFYDRAIEFLRDQQSHLTTMQEGAAELSTAAGAILHQLATLLSDPSVAAETATMAQACRQLAAGLSVYAAGWQAARQQERDALEQQISSLREARSLLGSSLVIPRLVKA